MKKSMDNRNYFDRNLNHFPKEVDTRIIIREWCFNSFKAHIELWQMHEGAKVRETSAQTLYLLGVLYSKNKTKACGYF